MTLTALNDSGVELAGGIQWIMMDGFHRVACWITREALDHIEGGNASQRERIDLRPQKMTWTTLRRNEKTIDYVGKIRAAFGLSCATQSGNPQDKVFAC